MHAFNDDFSGLVCCMAITTLLLANLIDKHLYYNQFKYADECSPTKSSTDKRPIASPWCLVLLRHRINTTQERGSRQKRHTLATFDFMHWKLNEPPAYVEPKFFGQRVRLKNFDVAPSWTNNRQTRPLFETPGTQAQAFQHVDQMAHTPAPSVTNINPGVEISANTYQPPIINTYAPPENPSTTYPSAVTNYPSSELESAVNQHSRIFNHTADGQMPVHSVESVATTTHIPRVAPVESVQPAQITQPAQQTQEEPTLPASNVAPKPDEPVQMTSTQSVAVHSPESIVSSKIHIQSQPVQTMELQPHLIASIERQPIQDQLPANDPLLTAVQESISDPMNPATPNQPDSTRYTRYHV